MDPEAGSRASVRAGCGPQSRQEIQRRLWCCRGHSCLVRPGPVKKRIVRALDSIPRHLSTHTLAASSRVWYLARASPWFRYKWKLCRGPCCRHSVLRVEPSICGVKLRSKSQVEFQPPPDMPPQELVEPAGPALRPLPLLPLVAKLHQHTQSMHDPGRQSVKAYLAKAEPADDVG